MHSLETEVVHEDGFAGDTEETLRAIDRRQQVYLRLSRYREEFEDIGIVSSSRKTEGDHCG